MKYILILATLLLLCTHAQAQKRKPIADRKESTNINTQHLKLYPTEADKYVNIYVEFIDATDIILTLEATDRSNEKSWKAKAVTTYQHSLDVSQLPPGNYSILLQTGKMQEKMIFAVKR